VRSNPGVTLQDAVDAIEHHYAHARSARSSLGHWLRRGKIKGVEARLNGRVLELHPSETEQ
jgi:hypothetical protein